LAANARRSEITLELGEGLLYGVVARRIGRQVDQLASLPFDQLPDMALLPLVFWFYAKFVPMDRYRQLTRARLRVIKAIMYHEFLSSAEEITYRDEKVGCIIAPEQMGEYQSFYGDSRGYRVKRAIVVFGIEVTLVSGYLWFAYFTYSAALPNNDILELQMSEPSEPIQIQVQNP
jgi:hypothetical protein